MFYFDGFIIFGIFLTICMTVWYFTIRNNTIQTQQNIDHKIYKGIQSEECAQHSFSNGGIK